MAKLKERFEELLHIEWGEFCKLESSESTTIDDTILCSLIRSCADTDNISNIKLAFDRADGILETFVDIKIPKFYIRYPNATEIEGGEQGKLPAPEVEKDKSTFDPATAKLRETLHELRKMPKDVIRLVLLYKKRIEKGIPVDPEPKVKSVICANLLRHVRRGSVRAIELVFDQIDGKLPKAIRLIKDDDVYVDDVYTKIAPAHAIKDDKGVYIAENKNMTNAFVRGFARSRKGLESLIEEVDDE